VMPEIASRFMGKVTNVFEKRGCVGFGLQDGAMVVEGSELLFVNGERYSHHQTVRSVQINSHSVRVVAPGERCAIRIDDFCEMLPPNNSNVFMSRGPQAGVSGKGIVSRVFHDPDTIGIRLEEGVLCEGDWIIIHGDDDYRHEQCAVSIDVRAVDPDAAVTGRKFGVLLDVDPDIGLPVEGDNVTVISIKK